jgi:hypothetical protein
MKTLYILVNENFAYASHVPRQIASEVKALRLGTLPEAQDFARLAAPNMVTTVGTSM